MIRKAILIFTGLTAAGVFAASWHFSTKLAHPIAQECPGEHFIHCGDPRSDLGLPFEEVTFPSKDGVTLRGWFIPRAGSKKALVLVHGITADRHEGLRWVPALHGEGYNLLLFDLRNHGSSDRAVTGMGFHEKNDVIGAVDYLVGRRGMQRLGVFGVSMGASTSIQAMAADPRIEAGVFEAGFANLGDLLAEIARTDFGLPRFPLIDLVMKLYGLRAGVRAGLVNPEDHIGAITPRPVFLIHCRDDRYIAGSHSERLFAAAGEPKTIWIAPCAIHAEAWQSGPREAERRVASFFNSRLGN